MKKVYISPTTSVVILASESLMLNGSDGHRSGEDFVSDESIGNGGESDGDDFAKRYDAWTTWD